MSEPTRYKYTWNLPGGKKRNESVAYGYSWEHALKEIHTNHPKRKDIRRIQ